jgi:hypothetical protein
MERERARERSGTVRVCVRGRSAREQLQRDLPREVMKWSHGRTLHIVDLIVPEVEPATGAMFTAHGRVSSRAVVFVHCKIRRRWPLARMTTVEFRVMDGLS